jgi:hypothetical protein
MMNQLCSRLMLLATLSFVSFLWSGAAKAQNTADVVGTVTDASGAVVASARVTIKNLGTNVSRSLQTGASGDYAFTLLPVGDYSVSVEASGFKTFAAPSITLAAGDRARVDAKMQVGSASQTVEVQATSAPILQTDSSTVGGLVTSEATQDLPTNGRNVITLVQLAPGANEGTQSSLGGGTRPDDRRQTSSVSANGQNDSTNNFLLDGMDNNERSIATTIVKPSIDSLEEVKVETNLFEADTGRVGGAVITMITKSGTNSFHGTAFEFLRNDMFDAKDVFNNPQAGNPLAGKKGEFRQNQFGGSLGGPIRKNKTFFFADYEGLRIIKGQTQTAFVPTPCELTGAGCPVASTTGGLAAGLPGNFSDLLPLGTAIYDPNTHLPFPNNIIPSSALNPIAVNYSKLYPVITGCTATNSVSAPNCQFVNSPNKTQYFHTADVRIDHHFSDKDTFFGRYTINNGDSSFPGAFPGVQVAGITVFGNASVPIGGTFPGSNYGRQQNITLGWDHIFRPDLLLDLRAGISRYVSLSTANNRGHNVNTLFGGPANVNVPSIKDTDGLALVSFQTDNYSSLGDQFALPTDYWDTNFQYTGALTWTKGPHSLKFGGSLLRRNWTRYQQLFKGWFQFNSTQTSGATGGGNAFASLLTGATAVTTQNMALVALENRDWEIGSYAQDDWRVKHWLTLNLGLRYDVFTAFTDKHNNLSNFDPTDPGVRAGGKILVAGQDGVSPSVNLPTQHNMFQPRIGFAASLPHSFVLRGGFGTSYYVSATAGPSQLANQPFATNVLAINQNLSTALPFPSEQPITECLVAACGAAVVAPGSGGLSVGDSTQQKFQNALIIMGNLTLEKAFGANDVSVGWVGEPGRHLGRTVNDVNVPGPPGLTGCGFVLNVPIAEPSPCQPFYSQLPYVGLISLLESNGENSYNALNVIFTRRSGKGLTVGANYTYAQALADVGGPGGPCDVCTILPNKPRYDWGFSDFDVRHRVAVTVDYEFPFGKSLTGLRGQIVKGWQVNGIYSFEGGLPFNADTNFSQTGLANTPDRPNRVRSSGSFHKSINEWFDISQFVLQPFGFPGNEGHNQLFGPAEKRIDLSLFKDFNLRESMKLEFRAEAFNLTNTPNFGTPNNTITAFAGGVGTPATNAGGFGSITSSNTLYNPREIQFALKLIF